MTVLAKFVVCPWNVPSSRFKTQTLSVPIWESDSASIGMRSAVRSGRRSAASSGSRRTSPTWRGARRRWTPPGKCLWEEFCRTPSGSGWAWRMEPTQGGLCRQDERDWPRVAFRPMRCTPRRGRSFPRTCLAVEAATFAGQVSQEILSSCEGAGSKHPFRRYSTWSQPTGQGTPTQSKV